MNASLPRFLFFSPPVPKMTGRPFCRGGYELIGRQYTSGRLGTSGDMRAWHCYLASRASGLSFVDRRWLVDGPDWRRRDELTLSRVPDFPGAFSKRSILIDRDGRQVPPLSAGRPTQLKGVTP